MIMGGRHIILGCIFSFAIIQFTAAKCRRNELGQAVFGSVCEHRCHCLMDAVCNQATGYCQVGCDPAWMGPACQFVNLAYKKPGNMSSTDSGGTVAKATDGDFNTCSKALRKRSSYLTIDLQIPYLITDMVLILPQDNRSLAEMSDFQIYVKMYNSSRLVLCYTHNDTNAPSAVMGIHCMSPTLGTAVTVRFGDTKTTLHVCELLVFGGREVAFNTSIDETGTVKPETSLLDGNVSTCGSASRSESNKRVRVVLAANHMVSSLRIHLPANAGSVPDRIRVGYEFRYNIMETLDKEDMVNVTYGSPPVLEVTFLNPIMARYIILYGTNERPRYTLTICDVEVFADCVEDRCGLTCADRCFCKDTPSRDDRLTAVCSSGCADRVAQDPQGRCNRECSNTTWGLSCEDTCGSCKNNQPCDVNTGSCPGKCASGFKSTPLCDECKVGKFGNECELICGICQNGDGCLRSSGVCIGGCSPGFQSPFCKLLCEAGKWGLGCNSSCSGCSDGFCDAVIGTCSDGCKPGWKDSRLCDKGCAEGFHGEYCIRCGNCHDDSPCNPVSGHCANGCTPGYLPPLCKTVCPKGNFGANCAGVCGQCQDGESCRPDNGECINGCVPGFQSPYCSLPDTCFPKNGMSFFGPNCNRKCHCARGSQCNHVTGSCPFECAAGWMGAGCQYANIAFDKAASLTSGGKRRTVAEATDGNSSSCTGDSSTNRSPSLDVNLGIPRYITDVTLVFPDIKTVLQNAAGFVVMTRLTSVSGSLVCYEHMGTSPVQPVMKISCRTPNIGDTIQVTFQSKRTSLNVCEIQVMSGREVSVNKPASQSKTQVSALFAVDGMLPPESPCAQTVMSLDPWLRIDLEVVHLIYGFHVYTPIAAGIAGELEINIEGIYGVKEEGLNYELFTGNHTTAKTTEATLTPPRHGRYVKISLSGETVLSVCEVIVFADCVVDMCGVSCTDTCLCKSPQPPNYILASTCPDGCRDRVAEVNGHCETKCSPSKWGPDCQQTCGACLNNAPCDVNTGRCPDQCVSVSLIPPFCKECTQGWYGADCDRICGACLDKTTCRPDTGECSMGCMQGWITDYCNITSEPLAEPEPALSGDVVVVPIVVGVLVGAAILILLVILGILVRRRWHRQKLRVEARKFTSNSSIYYSSSVEGEDGPHKIDDHHHKIHDLQHRLDEYKQGMDDHQDIPDRVGDGQTAF